MRLWHLARAALRSLAQHKLRSTLSSLGIVFGVGALVAMLAVAEGARRRILAQIESLGTNTILLRSGAAGSGPRSSNGLNQDLLRDLRATVPGLARVAPLAELRASVADVPWERPPAILGTTAEFFQIKRLQASQGRLLLPHDQERRNRVCVLGARVARELGSKGRIGSSLRCGKTTLEVVGILQARSTDDDGGQLGAEAIVARDVDGSLFLPLASAPALGQGPSQPRELFLAFTEASLLEHAPRWIRRVLDAEGSGARDATLVLPAELIAQARDAQRVFHVVLAAAALISLLAGGVGITNILLASVSERTHEIGLRRAVGASQLHIVTQFLLEALCLSLAGAAAGLLAGALAAHAVATYAHWPTSLTPSSLALATGMALATGLVAGLYPAVRAARLDPMAALRQS